MNKQPVECCPLCRSYPPKPYFKDSSREYLICPVCDLVFVPPECHLSVDEERQRYDLHRNDPADAGYRTFLNRLAKPMMERLAPQSSGLDFGSGPGPALAGLFEAAGHSIHNYDLFYAPDTRALEQTYDFVTATEVAEHLRRPDEALARMWSAIRPAGQLGIMTQLRLSPDRFADWHYKRDSTHIMFYSRRTFEWLANRWNAELLFVDNGTLLLRKTGAGSL